MELRAYLVPLRKWWWLLVLTTLVAASATYFTMRQRPTLFQTRATLMIGRSIQSPNPDASELYLTQQLAATYIDLAQRDAVRDAVMARLNLDALPGYTLKLIENTQLIDIVVTDTIPQRAQAVANALAEELAQQTPAGTDSARSPRQGFVNQQLDDLEASIKKTTDELQAKQEELSTMYSGAQIADAQTTIRNLQTKLSTLQSNYAALLSNTERGAVNSIKVIAPAKLPKGPISSGQATKVALAALIGLVIGAGIAYFLEYLDDSLKNPDQVRDTLGLTTLGAVPKVSDIGPDNELAVLSGNHSPVTEAYRVLRTNLQFASVDQPLHTMMITSAGPSEGKSMTAANLGATIAQAGRRVVLVDADLHRPRLHRVFGLGNSAGVTSSLLDESTRLENVLQDTQVPGLRVLTSGPLPPNPAELLGSARMRDLLARLSGLAEVVILDTPPALVLADAAVLSGQVDGVLVVLDAGKTRRELARRTIERLEQVHAHVLGVVLNRIASRGPDAYYYYNYYYNNYGRYYGSDNGQGGKSAGSKEGHRERSRSAGRKAPAGGVMMPGVEPAPGKPGPQS